VEKVEGEIGELVGPVMTQRFGKPIDMGNALRTGQSDLAVEHQRRQPGELLERSRNSAVR
jgi:hypothetical protein